MHVRISWGRLRPGTWDDYEAAYREFAAGAGAVEGLKGRMLARDVEDRDTGYAVSMWDSRDAMDAYEQSEVRQQLIPRLQAFFADDFITHRCVVTFRQDLP